MVVSKGGADKGGQWGAMDSTAISGVRHRGKHKEKVILFLV